MAAPVPHTHQSPARNLLPPSRPSPTTLSFLLPPLITPTTTIVIYPPSALNTSTNTLDFNVGQLVWFCLALTAMLVVAVLWWRRRRPARPDNADFDSSDDGEEDEDNPRAEMQPLRRAVAQTVPTAPQIDGPDPIPAQVGSCCKSYFMVKIF
jgi:hypothetical protein